MWLIWCLCCLKESEVPYLHRILCLRGHKSLHATNRILLVACSETNYYQLLSNIKVKVTSMHWVIMWTTLATCTILKGKKCHMKQWQTAVSLAGPWEPLNEKISYKSFGMAHAISNLIHYYFISVDSLSTPASGYFIMLCTNS